MSVAADYDSQELSQVLCSVDNILKGTDGNHYIFQVDSEDIFMSVKGL